ncbi:hypothetical protein GE061_010803 [Apolygus lucorum]|uniref:Cytochrome b-c1 complex subunit 9 n=1 Tax=Apolygus lucorum TaxID=248454 RepID=A0A8S9XXU5_APOLU|nr:hypothetical protein GE061_010803 [Apolygus lucorum]
MHFSIETHPQYRLHSKRAIMGMDHFYKFILRRTSTYSAACVLGAVIFERTFDMTTGSLYDIINDGKQWDDIKHKYDKNWKPFTCFLKLSPNHVVCVKSPKQLQIGDPDCFDRLGDGGPAAYALAACRQRDHVFEHFA